MKEQLKKLPSALQKQIILRLGAFVLSLMLFILVLILYQDIYFSLSVAALGLFFGIFSITLMIRLSDGKYIVIKGRCNKVEWMSIRKRPKTIYLNCESHMVKVHPREKLKGFEVGDTVILYVSESTPVYETEGYQLLSGYLAIEFWKGIDENDHE